MNNVCKQECLSRCALACRAPNLALGCLVHPRSTGPSALRLQSRHLTVFSVFFSGAQGGKLVGFCGPSHFFPIKVIISHNNLVTNAFLKLMLIGIKKFRSFRLGFKAPACVHPSEKIVIAISHLISSLDRDLQFFFIEHILKPDQIFINTHNHLKIFNRPL